MEDSNRAHTRVTFPDHVHFVVQDGEAVLMDEHSGLFFGLDEVGARVWELLRELGSVRTTVDRMLDEYDVEEDELRQDTTQLVSELEHAGLLRTHRP